MEENLKKIIIGFGLTFAIYPDSSIVKMSIVEGIWQ